MSALIESKSFWRRSSVLGARSAIAALSVVVLMLSLAACGGSGGANTSSTKQQIASAPIATTTTTTASPKPPTARVTHASSKTHKIAKTQTAATHTTSTAPTHTTTTATSPKKSGTTTSTTHTTITSQSTTPVTTTSQATTTSPKKPVKTTPVYARPMRATLVGENHAPKVNQPWSYSVTVTDASGHSMSGTVDIEFALSGTVVGHDKPPTDPITGNLHHTLKFPAAAVGVPLEVQAIVHTTLGSLTLDWPITVAL
jgi:hypothetical protein